MRVQRPYRLMVAQVLVVRHGRTRLNADGRLRGHLDPALDEVGRREAAAVAEALAGRTIAAILSSPLLRALQTADAIAAAAGVPVRTVDDLIDRDYGRWAGAVEADVVARFGSVDAAPGVEGAAAVVRRSAAVLQVQIPVLARGDVVLVTHEAVIRALLTHLDPSLPADRRQRTGCWNEIRRVGGRWDVGLLDQRPKAGTVASEDGR